MLDSRTLENIPENWLREAADYRDLPFRWTRWERPHEDWTHDHCRFCWACICDHRERHPELKDVHRERGCFRHAFHIDDPDVWVCRSCFKRLAPLVGWKAVRTRDISN